MVLEGNQRRTVNIDDAARMLGFSRNTTYQLVREGRLKSVRYGRRIVIPLAAIDRFLGDDAIGTQK